MATYYVDLSKGTTGAGSEGDPYDNGQFISAIAVSNSDTYYVKGSVDTGTNFFVNGGILLPWDPVTNGPWRVRTAGRVQIANAAHVFGGVLFQTGTSDPFQTGGNTKVYNCYLSIPAGQNFNNGSSGSFFGGCLINIEGGTQWGDNPQFESCAIHLAGVYNAGHGSGLYYCAWSGTAFGGSHTSSQITWTAPTLPAWDADQEAFSASILYAGVLTPPQPGYVGSGEYVNYNTDLWGNIRSSIGTGYMTPAPVWANTYPKTGSIGGYTIQVLSRTNETGMAYFVALHDGDTGPSSAQVKDGLNSIGVTGPVGMFGSVHLDADTEASMGVTGLSPETAYDIWVVAENSDLVLQQFPTGINVTTANIPPAWSPSYPIVDTYGFTGATFAVQTNETGMAYFVIQPNNAIAPNSLQVSLGLNGNDMVPSPGWEGSTTLDADTESTLNATNLFSNVNYDVYLVAGDSIGLLQGSPIKLDFKTQGPPQITVQPTNQTGNEGASSTFAVTATGDPAISSYQWYKGAVQLSNDLKYSGVDTSTLGVTGLVMSDAGSFSVRISNGALPITVSDTVTLTVNDITPPIWEATYPKAGTVDGNSAQLLARTNETGMAYFVTLFSGASAPSSAEVKAGTGVGGETGINFGSVTLSADTEAATISSGLLSQVSYDIYVVAEDYLTNLQASPSVVSVTTTDANVPIWQNSTPAVTALHGVTVDFSVQSSESGNAYFVALPSGATAPSSAEVKAGTGAGGATPVDVGSNTVIASTPAALIASGLVYETDYDVYFVAEDAFDNLQATPTLVSVTTLGNIVDLPGSIGIYRFQILFGATSFSTNHKQLIIPYTAYGNTALVADLTTYEYSLDSITWSTMTAAAGTVVTNLNFTPTGAAQSFTWEIKGDLGSHIYNKSIYIRFRATSGAIMTGMTGYSAYFSKIVVNEVTARNTPKLPEDYQGLSGSDLLAKAPKVGK